MLSVRYCDLFENFVVKQGFVETDSSKCGMKKYFKNGKFFLKKDYNRIILLYEGHCIYDDLSIYPEKLCSFLFFSNLNQDDRALLRRLHIYFGLESICLLWSNLTNLLSDGCWRRQKLHRTVLNLERILNELNSLISDSQSLLFGTKTGQIDEKLQK